jgi:predicted DNA-binding transcriptional regulator AlpA
MIRIGANMGTQKTINSRLYSTPAAPNQLFDFDRVVTESQAAEILGYSKDTLRREFRAGRAPARVRLSDRRIGYRLSAIYAFLDAHAEKPGAIG